MNITFQVEITEKDLAAALLPNGGKITNVTVSNTTTRARRSPSATTQKETAPKKAPTRAKKKTVSKAKTTS